jgi:hypothetical protein
VFHNRRHGLDPGQATCKHARTHACFFLFIPAEDGGCHQALDAVTYIRPVVRLEGRWNEWLSSGASLLIITMITFVSNPCNWIAALIITCPFYWIRVVGKSVPDRLTRDTGQMIGKKFTFGRLIILPWADMAPFVGTPFPICQVALT